MLTQVVNDLTVVPKSANPVGFGNLGGAPTTTYEGREYRIVGSETIKSTCCEKILRGLLGVAAVIFSLGLALFSSDVRKLFKSSITEKQYLFSYTDMLRQQKEDLPASITANEIVQFYNNLTDDDRSPVWHCDADLFYQLSFDKFDDQEKLKNLIDNVFPMTPNFDILRDPKLTTQNLYYVVKGLHPKHRQRLDEALSTEQKQQFDCRAFVAIGGTIDKDLVQALLDLNAQGNTQESVTAKYQSLAAEEIYLIANASVNADLYFAWDQLTTEQLNSLALDQINDKLGAHALIQQVLADRGAPQP